MNEVLKIGLGGGCHWCTEAVFQSLIGVKQVEQGFISPKGNVGSFSEAVIVHFNPAEIQLKNLIEIHLHTHKSTKNHSMREKYRSAVYAFENGDAILSKQILASFSEDFTEPIITQVYQFGAFKTSEEQFQNYYNRGTEKPFCQTHISPKIGLLMRKFSNHVLAEVKAN